MTASAGRTLLLPSLSLLLYHQRDSDQLEHALDSLPRRHRAPHRPPSSCRRCAPRCGPAPTALNGPLVDQRTQGSSQPQQPAACIRLDQAHGPERKGGGPGSVLFPSPSRAPPSRHLGADPAPSPSSCRHRSHRCRSRRRRGQRRHEPHRPAQGLGRERGRPGMGPSSSSSPSFPSLLARTSLTPSTTRAEHDQGHPEQGPARHARLGRSRPPPLRRHLAQHRLLCAPGLARRRTRRCVTVFTFSLNSRQLEHLSGLCLEADQRLTPSLLARSRCRVRRRGGQRPPRARRAPPDPVRRHHPLVHGRRPLGLRGASRALVPAPAPSLLFLVPSLTSFAAPPFSHAVGQVRRHQGQPALPPRRRSRHRGLGVAPHPGPDGARHPVGRLLRPVVHGPEGDDQGLGPQVVRDRASLFLSPSRLRFSRSGPSPPPRQFRRAGSALPLRSSRLLGCSHH